MEQARTPPLFAHPSKLAGKPPISLEVIVSLNAATRTTSGLKIPFQLDTRSYQKDGKVSDKEVAKLNLHRDQFHGEWNYEIHLRNAVLRRSPEVTR